MPSSLSASWCFLLRPEGEPLQTGGFKHALIVLGGRPICRELRVAAPAGGGLGGRRLPEASEVQVCFARQLFFLLFRSLCMPFSRSALLARRGRRRYFSEMTVKCRSCSRLHMMKDERTLPPVVIVCCEDFQHTCFFFCPPDPPFFIPLASLSRRMKTKPPRCIMWHRYRLNHISLRQIESKINVPASSC